MLGNSVSLTPICFMSHMHIHVLTSWHTKVVVIGITLSFRTVSFFYLLEVRGRSPTDLVVHLTQPPSLKEEEEEGEEEEGRRRRRRRRSNKGRRERNISEFTTLSPIKVLCSAANIKALWPSRQTSSIPELSLLSTNTICPETKET